MRLGVCDLHERPISRYRPCGTIRIAVAGRTGVVRRGPDEQLGLWFTHDPCSSCRDPDADGTIMVGAGGQPLQNGFKRGNGGGDEIPTHELKTVVSV
jgi:hypothetical protein